MQAISPAPPLFSIFGRIWAQILGIFFWEKRDLILAIAHVSEVIFNGFEASDK